MIISRGRGFIFVHIPKTGGTSVATALETRAMAGDILIGDTPKALRRRGRLGDVRHRARGRIWKHSRLTDLEGALTPDEIHAMRVVTIVRNPWDRMVSYYHWLCAQDFDHPAVARAQNLAFDAFVSHPDTAAEARNDAVSRYISTSDGREAAGTILRFEDLGRDFDAFAASLGFRLTLPHENRSRRVQDWRQYYSEATRARISRFYSEDIARFGYEF